MHQYLLLPGCDFTQVPEGLSTHKLTWNSDAVADIAGFRAHLLEFSGQLIRLLGADETPALAWALALRSLPEAEVFWFRADRRGWMGLDGLDVALETEPALVSVREHDDVKHKSSESLAATEDEPISVLDLDIENKDAKEAETVIAPTQNTTHTTSPAETQTTGTKEKPVSLMDMKFGELIRKAFLWAAWGEHDRALENLKDEAQRRATENGERNLPSKVARAEREGRIARDLTSTLEGKIKKGESEQDIHHWISEVSRNYHQTVAEHLENALRKALNHQKTTRARYQNAQGYESSLKPIVLKDGQHPNSLAHLEWAQEWRVFIDETGSVFDAKAEALSGNDKTLGRLVALVLPAGVSLTPLSPRFHATEASVNDVDKVVKTLLDKRVGIFGYSVNDPAVDVHQWIGHIQQLVRWVILQLPVRSDKSCVVNVLIEQKGAWNRGNDLSALAEVLEGEFQRLDGERFAGLRIKLALIDKTHELNGYVDTIAFTWGSSAPLSRDRLKKTRWLGHCLLKPGENAMQRLYLALNAQHKLPTQDWFDLCAAATPESQDMLTRYLDALGQRVAGQVGVWQGYLDDVRYRLHSKRFTLEAVTRALDWLERWSPQGHKLPRLQRLMLESARLALDSHGGYVDASRFELCLGLAESLHDEAPEEACEALLRMASGAANLFRFGLMRPMTEKWLNEPIAVPGLLNHAKLHSTLGQMLAFESQGSAALHAFDRALESFNKLSDPKQVERECAQTNAYRIITMMGDPSLPAETVQQSLLEYLRKATGKESLTHIGNKMAISGHENRFAHHIWLRALVGYPEAMSEGRKAYLKQSGQWQGGEGHPWPLIEAYRAWLFWDAARSNDARVHMHLAIKELASPDSGPVLRWMAEVLRTFAYALGMNLTDGARPSAHERQALCALLPHAPSDQLERFAGAGRLERIELLAQLRNCLPFNFH